eukprot:745999-Hanusia_phi.AAC.1
MRANLRQTQSPLTCFDLVKEASAFKHLSSPLILFFRMHFALSRHQPLHGPYKSPVPAGNRNSGGPDFEKLGGPESRVSAPDSLNRRADSTN